MCYREEYNMSSGYDTLYSSRIVFTILTYVVQSTEEQKYYHLDTRACGDLRISLPLYG
jgi:hypothetical protein